MASNRRSGSQVQATVQAPTIFINGKLVERPAEHCPDRSGV
jgi:hypothetical protein